MPRRLTRRRFALLGSIALTGLAGCGEVGEGAEEGEDDGDEEGGEDDGEAGADEEAGEEAEEGQFQPPENRQKAPRR